MRLGVQERVFQMRVRQRGKLEPGQDIIGALTQGLRASMNRLLEDETIGGRDRVFFTSGSDRLVNNYNGVCRRGSGNGMPFAFGENVEFQRTI